MVEGAGLENRYTLYGYRGFESHPLRSTTTGREHTKPITVLSYVNRRVSNSFALYGKEPSMPSWFVYFLKSVEHDFVYVGSARPTPYNDA